MCMIFDFLNLHSLMIINFYNFSGSITIDGLDISKVCEQHKYIMLKICSNSDKFIYM